MKLRYLPYLIKITILAAFYFGAAKVGLMFSYVEGNVTMIWPPTGIALAALLLFGYRLWPGVAIGAFLATASTGAPLGFALATAISNPLEALAGVYILQRIGFNNTLARVRDVAGLIFGAAGIATMISATIGVAGLCVTGMAPWPGYVSIWWPWWLGDAMGALIVAPVLLTWGTRPHPIDDWSAPQWLEAGAALLAGLATSLVAFGTWLASGQAHLPFAYLPFPALLWAGLRFGPTGAAAMNLVVNALAVLGTVQGFGPFAGASFNESLFLLWAFMGIASVTALLTAAITAERQQAKAILGQAEQAYRTLVDQLLQGIVVLQNGRPAFANSAIAQISGYSLEELHALSAEELLALVHPDDRSRLAQAMQDRLSGKPGSPQQEYRFIHKDGTICWLTALSSLTEYRSQAALQIVVLDITERVQALRQSEARYRSVVEDTPVLLCRFQPGGILEFVNAAYARAFGREPEELIGQSFLPLIPEEYRAALLAGLDALAPESSVMTDVIMPEMNGRELYQRLATLRPDIKVLYTSGYMDHAIVHHGILDAGVNFLQKPFTVQSLTRKVRQVLN